MDTANLKIKVSVSKNSDNYGNFVAVVHFTSEGVKLVDPPEVCVSRLKPGNCNYPIDNLAAHNSHSPPFSSEADMNAYIERVMDDVKEASDNYTGEVLDKPFQASDLNGIDEEDSTNPA